MRCGQPGVRTRACGSGSSRQLKTRPGASPYCPRAAKPDPPSRPLTPATPIRATKSRGAPQSHHADEHGALYPADECVLQEAGEPRARLGPYFMYYNFVRVHKSLRVSPAMLPASVTVHGPWRTWFGSPISTRPSTTAGFHGSWCVAANGSVVPVADGGGASATMPAPPLVGAGAPRLSARAGGAPPARSAAATLQPSRA